MQKNLLNVAHLNDEKAAYEHLSKIRWPEGPVCVHCQSKKVYTLKVAGTKRVVVEVWHLSQAILSDSGHNLRAVTYSSP